MVFWQSIKFSVIVPVVAMTAIACGGKGQKFSSLNDLQSGSVIHVLPIEGNEQVASPRLLYPTPIKFQVSDEGGRPLAGLAMEFKLCNIQGQDSEFDQGKIAALFDQVCGPPKALSSQVFGESALTSESDDGMLEEEYLGRINRADYVTDQKGQVTVAVEAARLFDTKVALLARVKDNPFSGGRGIALVTTASFDSAARLKLNSINGLKEKPGTAFEMSLTAIDNEGFAIRSFRGNMEIEFVADPKISWAGRLPEFPESGKAFVCPFSGGKCVIPGGPYTLRADGTVDIKITSVSGAVPETTGTITVEKGESKDIVFADRTGGPQSGAVVLRNIEVNSGEATKIAAAFVDGGGNYLSDASDAVWTSETAAIAAPLPTSPTSEINFIPIESGQGEVVVRAGEIVSKEPLYVTVPSGPQVKWLVRTEHGGTEVAGECFNVQVIAADANNNTNTSYTGTLPITAKLLGTESGPMVADVAHWSFYGARMTATMQTTVSIVRGVGMLAERACLFDATDVSPVIEIANDAVAQLAQFTGSAPVTVIKGSAAAVILSTAPPGDGIERACIPTGTNRVDDVSNPCIQISADLATVTYFPVIVDAGGNFLRATGSTWTISGPLNSSHSGLSISDQQVFTIGNQGAGLFNVTSPAPENFSVAYSYQVNPGAPFRYGVEGVSYNDLAGAPVTDNVEPFQVYTVSPFTVRLAMYDQKNNLTTNFDGSASVTVSLTNTTDSPIVPEPPATATPISTIAAETVNFVEGRGTTTGVLHVKNRNNSSVRIHVSGSLGDVYSAQSLQVSAGLTDYINLKSQPGGQGTNKALATIYSAGQVANTLFYVAGYDLYGNYTGPVSANLASTDIEFDGNPDPDRLPFTVEPSNLPTEVLQILPARSGSGRFTVRPTDTAIDPVTTETMTVYAGNAVRYRIWVGSWSGGQCVPNGANATSSSIDAGVDFCFKIDALNSSNDPDSDYTGNMNLLFNVASGASWAGDVATVPNGDVVCAFNEGICHLQGPYKLVNAGTSAIVTVSDRDGIVVDPEQGSIFGTAVIIKRGPASRLVIADKLGGPGPAASANVYKTPIQLTADDELPLAAARVDAGGNYVEDAPDAVVWSGTSGDAEVFRNENFVNQPATPAQNYPKLFQPAKAGSGTIQVAHSGLTGSTPQITIKHGDLHAVDIVTENNGSEVTAQCFTFTAALVDEDGNRITSYTASNRVNFTILNSVSGAPTRNANGYFCRAALDCSPIYSAANVFSWYQWPYQALTTSISDPAAQNSWPSRSIIQGVIETGDAKACLFDATWAVGDPKPKIKVDLAATTIVVDDQPVNFPAFSGQSGDIDVASSNPHHIHPALADDPNAPNWPCIMDRTSSVCTSYNADNGPIVWYGHVHDEGCNHLGTANGTWVGAGTLVDSVLDNSTLSGSTPVAGPDHAGVLVNQKATVVPTNGYGYGQQAAAVRFIAPSGDSFFPSGRTSSWPVSVSPGVPTVFSIQANGGSTVTADVPFKIVLNFYDQFLNIAGTTNPDDSNYTQVNATFSWNGTATNSPKGTAPVIQPNSTIDMMQGKWESSDTAFRIPNSSDSPVLTVGLGGAFGLAPKNFNISVVPGALNRTALLNQSCLTPGYQDRTNVDLSISTNQQLTYYHQGFDSEDNCIGALNATFSVQTENPAGALSGTYWNGSADAPILSATSGQQFTIRPGIIGNGKILVDPAASGMPNLTTGTISIGHGVFHSFEVKSSVVSSIHPAGDEFSLIVRAIDSQGNTVANFEGSKNLIYNLVYDPLYPNDTQYNEEGRSHQLASDGAVTFTTGMATVPGFKFFNSDPTILPHIRVTHVIGATPYYGYYYPSGIVPGVPHHYGTDIGGGNVWTCATGCNKFGLRVELRDEAGNKVDLAPSDPLAGDTNVSLSLKYLGTGSIIQDTLGGLPATIDLSNNEVILNNLFYTVAGRFEIQAGGPKYPIPTNGASGHIAFDDISFRGNNETIDRYDIITSGNASVGVPYFIQLKALDKMGNVIKDTKTPGNIDQEISGPDYFSWTGPSNGPLGNAPVLPTTIDFVNGSAAFFATFYRAETINLVLTDDLSNSEPSESNKSGTIVNFTVNPGAVSKYTITSETPTSRVADSTAGGLMQVRIRAYDEYMNPRAGDGNLTLRPVLAAGYAGSQVNVGQFNVTSGPTSGAFTALNLGSGELVTNSFWYNVGHSIQFTLDNMSGGATVLSSDTVNLTPTINTVSRYLLVPSSTSITAGNSNLSTDIQALDGGDNIITQDIGLSAQTYTWSGAATSPAPTSSAPVYNGGSTSITNWTNGVASASHSLRAAQTLSTSSLRVTDNHANARTGSLSTPVVVAPATLKSYDVAAVGGVARTAGSPFNITLTARDAFSNIATNWTTDNLTFSWSGTTAVIDTPNPAQPGGQLPTVLAAGAQSFSSGAFTSSGTPFTLYKSSDASPVLTVTSGHLAGLAQPSTFTLSGWTTAASSTVDYVEIRDGSTAGANLVNNHTMTTDQTYTLYSHGYDFWGNRIGLVSASWTATNQLSGRLTIANGTSTVVDPNLIGNGVVRATPSVGLFDETGTFTVNQGAITKLVFAPASFSITADDCQSITLTAQDADSNAATVAELTTIGLSANNGGLFFNSASDCTTGSIASTTISAGQSSVSLKFAGRNAGVTSTLTGTKTSPASPSWTAASASATVSSGVITKIVWTNAALSQVAGVCGALAFATRDQYNNNRAVSSNTTLSLASTSGTGSFHSASDCSGAALTSVVLNSGLATGNLYYKDTAAGVPTLTISESPAATPDWTNGSQSATINPGTFSITGPGSLTKLTTPTVTWSASTGAPSYEVKIDNNSGCSSPERTFSSVATTSQVITPALTDGTWYICVTANANGATAQNASNNSYTMVVDATIPTITYTVPAYRGPDSVAGATHSISGTAADSGSGVGSVQVSLQHGSGSCLNTGKTAFDQSCPHWIPATGTTSWSVSSINDSLFTNEGVYHVRAKSVDVATNESSEATASFTWNTVLPTVNLGSTRYAKQSYNFNDAVATSAPAGNTLTYAWSKLSGPGTITFGSSTAKDTTVSASAQGTYVLQLQVTDISGYVVASSVSFVWDTTLPTINPGSSKVTNVQVLQDATVTDSSPIVSYLWEKESGPGTVNFSAANAEDTNVSATQDGTYSLRLTAVDSAGNSHSVTVSFVWDTTAPSSTIATSGTIGPNSTAGINTVLSGTAADATAGLSSVQLSIQKGTGSCLNSGLTAFSAACPNFINASGTLSWTLTVADSVLGNELTTYNVLRRATDLATNVESNQSSSFVWDGLAPVVNIVPLTINASAAHTIAGGDVSATDDSTPLAYAWTKDSGTGVITFNPSNTASTQVSSNTDGTFVLRLTVTDAYGNTGSDTVTFVWDTSSPVVNAGSDKVVRVPTLQNATVTDTTSLSYAWSKVSGPGDVTFSLSSTIEDPTISANADGEYVIRLTATDALSQVDDDDISFVWDTTPPSVNAGSDILTNGMASINATVTSDGLSSLTYVWTKQSGPGTVTFGTPNAEDTTATASQDGAYVLRLTVTDAAGNSSHGELTMTRDTEAPSVFSISSVSNANTSTPTVSWANNADAAGYNLTIKDNSGCTGTALQTHNGLASGASSQQLTSLDDGRYFACIEAVDSASNARSASNNGFAFDVETSVIHVAYTKTSGSDYVVSHGVLSAGSWTHTDLLSSADVVSTRTSLAIDSANRPFVSYAVHHSTNKWMLQYRDFDGSAFNSPTVVETAGGDTDLLLGTGAEIALNSSDAYSVSYAWSTSNPDPAEEFVRFNGANIFASPLGLGSVLDTTIAIDSSNKQHLIYTFDSGSGIQLKYSKNDSGWSAPSTIDSSSCLDSMYAQMFLSESDQPVVAYICRKDTATDDSCFVNYAKYNGTTWTHVEVGSIKASGCLATDFSPATRPSISRVGASGSDAVVAFADLAGGVKVAKVAHATGTVTGPVQAVSGAASYVNVSSDLVGKLYVLFHQSGALKLVHNNSTPNNNLDGSVNWTTTNVIGSDVTGVGGSAVNGLPGRSNRP